LLAWHLFPPGFLEDFSKRYACAQLSKPSAVRAANAFCGPSCIGWKRALHHHLAQHLPGFSQAVRSREAPAAEDQLA
jgi:hypothetical protein